MCFSLTLWQTSHTCATYPNIFSCVVFSVFCTKVQWAHCCPLRPEKTHHCSCNVHFSSNSHKGKQWVHFTRENKLSQATQNVRFMLPSKWFQTVFNWSFEEQRTAASLHFRVEPICYLGLICDIQNDLSNLQISCELCVWISNSEISLQGKYTTHLYHN